jgi:hypothetical protein
MSSAEEALIDLVAPAGVTSSVLPVCSSGNMETNSIMDEPIDVAEQGKLASELHLIFNVAVP